MSYTTPKFADDVIALLTAAGYAVRCEANELPEPGCRPEGGFWLTVGGVRPEGMGECDTELGAWIDALQHLTARAAPLAAPAPVDTWVPTFSKWRHGGWYVTNLQYPGGALGCVSNNYLDRRWRIVCDPRGMAAGHVYPSRDAAARAERALVLAGAQ